jgi:hypothetical protein
MQKSTAEFENRGVIKQHSMFTRLAIKQVLKPDATYAGTGDDQKLAAR